MARTDGKTQVTDHPSANRPTFPLFTSVSANSGTAKTAKQKPMPGRATADQLKRSYWVDEDGTVQLTD